MRLSEGLTTNNFENTTNNSKSDRKKRTNETMKAVVPSSRGSIERLSMDQLAAIPEEQVWLASRKSARTRRAYHNDVAHFMRTFGIQSPEELRKIDHRAVMAWERLMREEQGGALGDSYESTFWC
jgi:hypothetical protein